jgi:hypothetical protein
MWAASARIPFFVHSPCDEFAAALKRRRTSASALPRGSLCGGTAVANGSGASVQLSGIEPYWNTNQKEGQMNRVSIALVVLWLLTSHLMAQRADVRGVYRNPYGNSLSRQNCGVRQTLDGSVCYPAPWYDTCIYDRNPCSLDLYRIWTFYTTWNGVRDNDPPQPTSTNHRLLRSNLSCMSSVGQRKGTRLRRFDRDHRRY